jgi:enoyl-CoA hydratase/carnithine racemase
MELAMMADIRVASERAKFGELFVLRGLVSDVAGIGRLAQLVGRERAAELLFTGDVIDAASAHTAGLVSRVVAHVDLLPTAHALAARIAARSGAGVIDLILQNVTIPIIHTVKHERILAPIKSSRTALDCVWIECPGHVHACRPLA